MKSIIALAALVVLSVSLVKAQTEPIRLYLTFDDGPSTGYEDASHGPTVELLEILDRYGVRATFFMPGESVNFWEDELVARILLDGHAIGIHSFHHGESFESNGLSDQELANQFLRAWHRIYEILADYPEAQELFASQPPLYRRPGGSAHLSYFLDPSRNTQLELGTFDRRLIAATFDYSGWSLSVGDSVNMVINQVNLGDPSAGVSEIDQTRLENALWEFLWSGKLLNGTQTSYPGLSGMTQAPDGLVVLAHDNFLSVVRSWDTILPRLIDAGYSFDVLPRPSDYPNFYIMGMG